MGCPTTKSSLRRMRSTTRAFVCPPSRRDACGAPCGSNWGFGDRPVLLFCGKFSEVKAPQLLLSAYRRLRQSGIDASLWLCGDGALRDSLVQDVARGAIPDVRVLGFRNQRELPGLYAAADVLVVPSQRRSVCDGRAEAIRRSAGDRL